MLHISVASATDNQVELFYMEPLLLDDIELSPEALPIEAIQEFVSVYEKIRSNYIKKYSDKELFKIAMEGMLLRLDPYSAYLNKEETKLLYEASFGLNTSIGVNIVANKDHVKVVAPFDDSPAARAGIISGDLIVKINQVNVKGLTAKNVYALLDGEPGSQVDLTILRRNKLYNFKMNRETIDTKSVISNMLDEGIGYIRIKNFQRQTPSNLLKQLKGLINKGAEALILDLRNNPGGIFEAGIEVADVFLKKGVLVAITGRNPASNISYHADDIDYSEGMPIIVLINGGTASAAEFVTAALQENDRAEVLGKTSFGKGLIQSVYDFGEEHSIMITSGSFRTPSNKPIEQVGVSPDHTLNEYSDWDVAISEASIFLLEALGKSSRVTFASLPE